MLSKPVEAAGTEDPKLQKELTKQREAVKFQQLDVDIRALPSDDMRRHAWVNLDRFSTTWVSTWPDKDAYLSNAEFSEVVSFYFGAASPACTSMVCERVAMTQVGP